MSIPPNPPPNQPGQSQVPSKNNKRMGAIAAILVVVLIAALFGIVGALTSGRGDQLLATAIVTASLVSLASVVVGSILTIFKPVRQFAVGFLSASAVLMVVTAGGCVAVLSSSLNPA